MKTLLLPFSIAGSIAGLASPVGDELRTDYAAERTLRVTSETEVTVETTDFSIERDGEPMDTGGWGGGGPSTTATSIVHLDKVTAHEDGRPTGLERTFEQAGRSGGEDSVDSPLDGETLVLTMDEDGDVRTELESGVSPDPESVLEGHRLTLALDALLPEDEVSGEDSWELDGEAVAEALGIRLSATLFPRPEYEPGGGGRGEGGGRRRGPGGMGGRTAERLFQSAEWDASARLAAETVQVDGVECFVIELDLEAEGELEEEERPWGGHGRGHGLESGVPSLATTEFEIDLEGQLFFSKELGRPLGLEIEGDFSVESERTRERGDSTMTIYIAQEGTFTQTVSITEERAQ